MLSDQKQIKLSKTPTLQSAVHAHSIGNLKFAKAMYCEIIQNDPTNVDALNNLGVLLRALGNQSEAEIHYKRAITLRPDFYSAVGNLANLLKEGGRFYEAEKYYRDCITIFPGSASMQYQLGNALLAMHRYSDAERCYRNAIEIKPDFAEAYTDLGNARKSLNCLVESEAFHRKAILLNPQFMQAYNNLGYVLGYQGRMMEAIESLKVSIELKPHIPAIHSNLLFYMNYMPELSKNEKFIAAKKYSNKVAEMGIPQYQTWVSPKNSKKIRIGFLSGDFREHPVTCFLKGLLSKIDRSKFDLFAYSTNRISDNVTEQLKNMFSSWTVVFDKKDEEIAQIVHQDGVQILIDLSGHTAGNRLPVFLFKPAPIQISWLGYCATTGISEIDYIIADPIVAPIEDDKDFVEHLWRLPETYLNWTPPSLELNVSELPALQNGYITFGCFNNFSKVNDEVLRVWSRILKKVSGSRLYFKSGQLTDPLFRNRLMEKMNRLGVTHKHLIIEGSSNHVEYYNAFHNVDIALDPFPFPGATTSMDGLWMGVPVITKKGNCFLARNGETIAQNCGQWDWVAADKEDYVRKAVSWSNNVADLANIRSNLRSKLLESPLLDSNRFARSFEAAMTEMYLRYLNKTPSSGS